MDSSGREVCALVFPFASCHQETLRSCKPVFIHVFKHQREVSCLACADLFDGLAQGKLFSYFRLKICRDFCCGTPGNLCQIVSTAAHKGHGSCLLRMRQCYPPAALKQGGISGDPDMNHAGPLFNGLDGGAD